YQASSAEDPNRRDASPRCPDRSSTEPIDHRADVRSAAWPPESSAPENALLPSENRRRPSARERSRSSSAPGDQPVLDAGLDHVDPSPTLRPEYETANPISCSERESPRLRRPDHRSASESWRAAQRPSSPRDGRSPSTSGAEPRRERGSSSASGRHSYRDGRGPRSASEPRRAAQPCSSPRDRRSPPAS